MAKRKTRKRRKSRSLSGLGGVGFNASRINQHSVVSGMVKPVAMGLVGAAAGHFAGKGKNLILAGVGGLAAIALGYGQEAMPAVIGCAVVTPPAPSTATAGIEGLEGLKDFVSDGANRSKGFVKSFLSNAGLQSVADKIPVSGLAGLGDVSEAYDEGYMAGIGDMAALEDGSDDTDMSGLNGTYLLAQPGATTRSMAAALSMG